MISPSENVKQYSTHIILQCIQDLKTEVYLLIKPLKRCSACKCNHCRLDFPCICQCTSLYLYSIAFIALSISLSVRPADQQQRQLAMRFYYKWYFATSGVSVLARRFRLASNRYIVCESTNISSIK